MKQRQPQTPLAHLEWAIGARNRIQLILLRLHKIGGDRPQDNIKDEELGRVYGQLIGVGFSVWRAAFLADVAENVAEESLLDASDLLNKLLTDNAVSFQIDRSTRNWMCGYYLNSAALRLVTIIGMLEARIKRVGSPKTVAPSGDWDPMPLRTTKNASDLCDLIAEALERAINIFSECLQVLRVETTPTGLGS